MHLGSRVRAKIHMERTPGRPEVCDRRCHRPIPDDMPKSSLHRSAFPEIDIFSRGNKTATESSGKLRASPCTNLGGGHESCCDLVISSTCHSGSAYAHEHLPNEFISPPKYIGARNACTWFNHILDDNRRLTLLVGA